MEYDLILQAVDYLQKKGVGRPQIGIILGTGLDGLTDNIELEHEIPYRSIPHFVEATVDGHKGSLLFGRLHGMQVVMMRGRFHLYEGYSMDQITFPVRVMKMLGIKQLLISNACGGLNLDYRASDLVLLDDHINFLPGNPLVGRNINELGPRFPDMSEPYCKQMNQQLTKCAKVLGIGLHAGVYAAWIGPSLETRAEYRFLRNAGADVVGMSTVPEVIVANHMNLPVAAISVVTDLCNPDNLKALKLEDVLHYAAIGGAKLSRLIEAYLTALTIEVH